MVAHGFTPLDPFAAMPSPPVEHLRLWDCRVTWRDVNPAPGAWDWARLDAIVALAEQRDMDICLVLGGTPAWAAREPEEPHAAAWIGPGSNSPPHTMNNWTDYVRKVVVRYAGRIHSYQIWNEPMLREFWSPYGQIAMLAQMTLQARTVIRRVDPQARVVAAPVMPRPSSGGMRRSSAYLTALRRVGWPVDVMAAHVYPEIDKGPARWRDLVLACQIGLRALDAPKAPLWVTETNYNLMGGPLPVRKVKRDIALTDHYAAELGVARVYWYAYGRHSDPRVLGIRFQPGSAGDTALTELLSDGSGRGRIRA